MWTPRLLVKRRISAGTSWVRWFTTTLRTAKLARAPFLIGSGGGKHSRAVQPRYLNRRLPTPLPAPRTSTSSPGRTCAFVTSMCHAVTKVSGKRRGFDKANRVRNRDEIARRHAHQLGVAAVALRSEHVVARALVVAPVETRVALAA